MGLNAEASAALVFLILYAILFIFLFLGYVTGRLPGHSSRCCDVDTSFPNNYREPVVQVQRY
jgi:hypothetical protein